MIKVEDFIAMTTKPYFYIPSWDNDVFEVNIVDLLPDNMALVRVIYSDRYGLYGDYNYTFVISLKYIFKTHKQAHKNRKRWEKSIKKRQSKQENNS